jgi:hypothetical protein
LEKELFISFVFFGDLPVTESAKRIAFCPYPQISFRELFFSQKDTKTKTESGARFNNNNFPHWSCDLGLA